MSDIIRTVLLGDSIRQNYGVRTAERLGAAYSVWQPEDNCRFIKYTQRGVFYDWRENLVGSDIIHFNCGLWDTCDLTGDGPFSPLEEYLTNLDRTAAELQRLAKAVIFATTTPVRPGQEHNFPGRIEQYNEAAARLLEKRGVMIDDLYTPVMADMENCIREDDLVHLTDYGIELCSGIVANCIRRAAAEL